MRYRFASMTFTRICSWVSALALIVSALVSSVPAWAQSGTRQDTQHYESRVLGISFEMPADWQVRSGEDKLLAGTPADLDAMENGTVPLGLAVRMTFGTFNQLGITDASQLPALLNRLVSSEVAAPATEPTTWGNASGYQALVTLPDEGMTTRVALLAIAGGRVAIVRGMAPISAWDTGASAQLDALAASLQFRLPQRDENYIQSITSNDGGVLWHHLSDQPDSGRVVNAGGIVYDPFDVMYMVVGPGGIMALDMNTGNRISFLGPWYDGDFVDIAIGPDLKLYLANVVADTWQAITVVDRAGNWTRGWGTRGDGNGEFAPDMPQTITVVGDGSVWTVSEGHTEGIANRLYQFDAFGNLLQTIDLAAINPDLSGVRMDVNAETGALYLVGATGNLNVIDSHGEPLVVNLAAEVLQDLTPVDIAIAPDDNIVLALDAPGLDGFGFLELSVAGRLLDVFGFPFDEARGGAFLPGEYAHPGGLLIGPDGTGYWTETHPATGYVQVQRFTFTGDGLLQLGAEVYADQQDTLEMMGSADPARGGGTIAYGQSVHGALNNRYPAHEWNFEGRKGDHVNIIMTDASGAGLLDPQLKLWTRDGREIAGNDDVGDVHPEGMTRRDARIDFFLPDDGIFVIEAGRFGGRGDYILSLELVQ
jgi:hypothetical protein